LSIKLRISEEVINSYRPRSPTVTEEEGEIINFYKALNGILHVSWKPW
jgi:hypothetical protein